VTEITLWLFLLLRHWQNWASGGSLAGLVILIVSLIERMRGRTMSKKWYVLLFVVCFILGASFMVWKDEHQTVQRLETQIEKLSIPKLSGRIDYVAVAPCGKKNENSLITIMANITNTGAPSIVSYFKVTIKIGNEEVKSVPVLQPSSKIILFKSAEKEREGMVLQPADYLPRKGIVQPIVMGGGIWGFVQSFVPNVSKKQIYSDGLIILHFKDVSGKDYSIQFDYKTNKDKVNNMSFIGLDKVLKER
jgi:hypothetical protein